MYNRIVRKIDIRLMPTTALIYLLCYLDRSNIGKRCEWPIPIVTTRETTC